MSLIFLAVQIFHIIYDHQRDLESQCIIKAPQIQAGALLNLLNTIYQRITMHEQLSGSLRHIQIVLKELVQCIQCLFVQIVGYIVSEDLFDEDLAQMESIVEEMKIFGEDDLGDLVDCDCRFHQVIVEKAGLNRLLKAWTELNYGNIVCYFAGNSDRKEAANRQHDIHERLLNVFRSKDEETICNAISEHYMKTVKRLIKEGSMSDEGFKYKV